MTTTPKDKPKRVRGILKPASADGFKDLIESANDAAEAGFTLVGVVNVGRNAIGGVLVFMPRSPASTGNLV